MISKYKPQRNAEGVKLKTTRFNQERQNIEESLRLINAEILENERAEYGKEIVSALSRRLTSEYGKGFTRSNIFYMIRFAEFFPDEQIVHALSGQLSLTHFLLEFGTDFSFAVREAQQ